MSHCIGLNIQEPTTKDALNDLQQYPMDGYDIFQLQAMKQGKATKIITDDADFVTVPGLEVFTCNLGLISLAKSQGHCNCKNLGQTNMVTTNTETDGTDPIVLVAKAYLSA